MSHQGALTNSTRIVLNNNINNNINNNNNNNNNNDILLFLGVTLEIFYVSTKGLLGLKYVFSFPQLFQQYFITPPNLFKIV